MLFDRMCACVWVFSVHTHSETIGQMINDMSVRQLNTTYTKIYKYTRGKGWYCVKKLSLFSHWFSPQRENWEREHFLVKYFEYQISNFQHLFYGQATIISLYKVSNICYMFVCARGIYVYINWVCMLYFWHGLHFFHLSLSPSLFTSPFFSSSPPHFVRSFPSTDDYSIFFTIISL